MSCQEPSGSQEQTDCRDVSQVRQNKRATVRPVKSIAFAE